MKTVVIGGAWPYANGSLHIGHIAALLPEQKGQKYFMYQAATVTERPLPFVHSKKAPPQKPSASDITENFAKFFKRWDFLITDT